MQFKTIKIRLKDTASSKYLSKASMAVNFVWNYCNDTSFNAIRKDSRFLSGYDLQKLTSGSSKELNIPSVTIESICTKYASRRLKSKKRKLRWRGKKSLGWVPFKPSALIIKNGEMKFCGQHLKVFQPKRLPSKGTYDAGEFSQDSRGRWYVCISVKYESTATEGCGQVGVDLGLSSVATLSNSEKVVNGKYYRMMQRRLGNAQRNKKKRLVKTLNAKTKNQRMDALHKASTKIVKENKLIVVGKLSAKKLVKTKMAKSVNDAGLSMFKTMLKYKASARQCWYVEVNEANTTRTCSSCGVIPDSSPKGVKGLSIREWACSGCGSVHDRDVNAAINILRLGRQTLKPEVAQKLPTGKDTKALIRFIEEQNAI